MLALLPSSLRKAATLKDRLRWSTERQILKKSQKRYFYASRNLKDSVYAFGDNSLSQCGVLEEANTSVPRKVQELQQNLDVVAVVAGWKGTMLLTDSKVVAWGTNETGQLCLPHKRIPVVKFPTESLVLTNAKTRAIALGRGHAVLIVNNPTQIITVGLADVGQIGIEPVNEECYPWPQLVTTLDSIIPQQVVAGLDHTVVRGVSGQVYTWGLGGNGQLGYEVSEAQIQPTPQVVEGLPSMVKIFSGADHSGGVDAEGTVWVWGSNASGQIGLEEPGNYVAPAVSNWDREIPIREILGGGQHTVILTKDGEVWVVGRAEEGSLGLGIETTQNQFEWRKVDFFTKNNIKIRSIAVGFAHNLALAEDGRVFAWGSNNMGQLGLGDSKDRWEPTEIEYFRERQVKGVACGSLHSVVWGEFNIL